MWSLIRILRGENITPTLAQEAGHFAIGALGKDALVHRLDDALTTEVMRSIVSDEDMTVLGKDPRREIMGRLVGNAIMEDGNNRDPLYKLAKRIWNKAKRIFFGLVGDNVQLMVMDAKAAAEQIAQGFMSPDFKGSVENALSYEETLFDADLSEQTKVFKEITNNLKLLGEQMKNIFGSENRGEYKDFRRIAPDAELGFDINATDADHVALDRIAGIIEDLEQLMIQRIPDLLASVDLEDVNFMDNVGRYSKNLRAVHHFCQTVALIQSAIGRLDVDSTVKMDLNRINPRLASTANPEGKVSIKVLMDDLAERVKRDLLRRCVDKEYAVFLKFLQMFYGKDYVQRSARVVFNFEKGRDGRRGPTIKALDDQKVTLAEALKTLNNDISYIDRYLSSMANNPDIIGGLTDKVAKYANKRADDATNYVWDELRKLDKMLKSGEIGTDDTRIFCETDDDGNITGNYLSRVEFWKWEERYNDFIRNSRVEFYANVFDTQYNTTMSDAKRAEYDKLLSKAKTDT